MTAAGVLRDVDLDRRLARDGFVVLPLLSRTEAAALREEFGRLKGWVGEGFRSDLVDEDTGYRTAANAVLQAADHHVTRVFADREVFLRSFLCKYPGPDSALYLHRDWMYVDERRGHRTHAAWIALEDITGHNGQLQVLRGSHELGRDLRGTDLIPQWMSADDVIRPRLVSVPVPVGHCVVFDNALVHCSLPNNTDRPRLAVAFGLRRADEDLVHFRRGDVAIERYAVDPSFFLAHTPADLMGAPPTDLEPAETLSDPIPELSSAEVARRLDRAPLARLDHLRARLAGLVASTRPDPERWERMSGAGLSDCARRLTETSRRGARRARSTTDQVRARLTEVPSNLALHVLAANEAIIDRVGPDTRAIWDPHEFPWSHEVAAAFPQIRNEVDALLRGPREIPHIEDVVGGIPQGNEGPWRTFVLMHQGRWIPWNLERCPRTTEVVRHIPGLTMAGFSVLEPGTHITEHRGPNKGALRYQLGVKVPGPPGACRIRVGTEELWWRDGEGVMFDFTVPHEAWNDTEEVRVLLMLEVITPLPWYLRPGNRLAQRAMGWFPTTRDITSRLRRLEPTLVRSRSAPIRSAS